MRSYLIMAEELLVEILQRLWHLLKMSYTLLWRSKLARQLIALALLLNCTWLIGARYGASSVVIPEPEVIYVTPDPAIMEMFEQYQEAKSIREQNITSIAKVLYWYRNNSARDLEGIVFVILNRVDNQAEFRDYDSIQMVVNQPSQWTGYSEDNPVLEELYDIAEAALNKYENDGKRPFGQEYLYFEWRSDYITFKTELYDSKTCQKTRLY